MPKSLKCNRESFKQEAMSSWVSYQEDGRHVTGPEICAWLNTWGTDEEIPAPRSRSGQIESI